MLGFTRAGVLDSGSLSRKLARPTRLGDHLLSCKLLGRCCRLTSWGFSEVSASFSHLCRRGFSLHMFLKLSCRASKRQMVVWLNILPANTQKHHQISHKLRMVNFRAKNMMQNSSTHQTL